MTMATGQMAVQGNVGGGSFVCGLKRILTPHDSIEMQAAVGVHPQHLSSLSLLSSSIPMTLQPNPNTLQWAVGML